MNKSSQLSSWWEDSRSGDVGAFKCIHNELFPGLFHYLLKILKDEDVCYDLLQDLFIKLWEKKEKLGPISNVKVYFFKSARSIAINYIKSDKVRYTHTIQDFEIEMVFSQEEILVNKEINLQMKRQLSVALNGLPKRQREMIFLKYFDGWNYEQIAEVTGIKYQSVVNHVHRGILQLRTELSEDKYMADCRVAV